MFRSQRCLTFLTCLPLCLGQLAHAQAPGKGNASVKAARGRTDRHGDPLPEGAIARLGTVRLRHPGLIQSVSLSPDGKLVASAGGKAVRLWDVASGKLLREHPLPGGARCVAFAPNGKSLVYAGRALNVVDVASGRQQERIVDGSIEALAISPNSGLLATGDFKGRVRLRWLVTGKEVHTLKAHQDRVFGLAFAPEGDVLVSAGEDGSVRFWDVVSGLERRRIAGPKQVFGLAFSHDGKLLAWGDYDGVAHVVDAATGKEVRQFRDDRSDTRSQGLGGLAFSPDDRVLIAAAGWWEAMVRLWDVATGKELRRLVGNRSDAYAFALSADGKTVALGGENDTVRLWDVPSGKELHAAQSYQGRVRQVAWSPDGSLLAVASSDRLIRLWDATTRREVRRLPVSGQGGLVFAADGKTLAAGAYHQDGLAILWDVGTGKLVRRLPAVPVERAHAVCLSSDGKLLASCDSKTVFVWETATGKEVHKLAASHPRALAFARGRPWLAVSDQGHGLRVWDMAAGRNLWQWQGGSQGHLLHFIDDDRALISVVFPGQLRVSETATGKELRAFGVPGQALIESVALSPDGRLLLVGDACGCVTLGEMLTGKEVRSFAGHNGAVDSVAFAPDGRTVVSGSKDTTALLWDATGRAEDGTLRPFTLATAALRESCARLGSKDAAEAYRALWALVAAAEQAVPLLARELGPAPEAKRLAALIADLDDKRFAVREKAFAELAQLGDLAEHALRQALAAKPPLEMRRRLERLLRRLAGGGASRRLQRLRAVAVLEHIGTPAAQNTLRAWVGGDPEAELTREVRASLQRLARRSSGTR